MARWSPQIVEQAAPSFVENLAKALGAGVQSYQQAGQQRIAREDHERQIANETDDRTFRRTQAKNAEMRQADEDALRGIHAAGWTPDGVASGADALAPESIGRGPMPDLAGTLVAPPSTWRPPGVESDLVAPPPGWTPPRDMRPGPNAGDFSGFEAALLEHPDAMQPPAPPAPRSSSGHPGGYDRVSGRFIPVQRMPMQTLPSGRVYDPNVQNEQRLAQAMEKQRAREAEVNERVANLMALRGQPGYEKLTPEVIRAAAVDPTVYASIVKNEQRAPVVGSPEWEKAQRFTAKLGRESHQADRRYDAANPTQNPSSQRAAAKQTEGQANTRMFAERMSTAETRLQQHESSGKDGGWTGTVGRLPIVGNMLVGGETQQYRQAQRDWVRAKLRKESGASISPDEMAGEITTYFPQVGDTDEVIQQKAQSRMEAAVLMMRASRGSVAEEGSEVQRDWDAAVAKHGKLKVLKDFGPRPE